MNKEKFIKISKIDFLKKVTLFRSEDSYFRSLEAYLVKYNRNYNIDRDDCFIYVKDKEDAMNLGIKLDFRKINYFDGEKSLPIVLIKKRKKNQTKVIIDIGAGELKTLGKINTENKEEIKSNYLTFSEVVLKREIFTKIVLEKLIASGDIEQLIVKNRRYISKESLARYLMR